LGSRAEAFQVNLNFVPSASARDFGSSVGLGHQCGACEIDLGLWRTLRIIFNGNGAWTFHETESRYSMLARHILSRGTDTNEADKKKN